MKVKPVNPVVKAMIEQPNRSIKKHKSSRWKLFKEVLEKEIRQTKDALKWIDTSSLQPLSPLGIPPQPKSFGGFFLCRQTIGRLNV